MHFLYARLKEQTSNLVLKLASQLQTLQAPHHAAVLPKQSSVDSRDLSSTVATPLEIDDTAMFQRKKTPSVSLEASVTQLKKVK